MRTKLCEIGLNGCVRRKKPLLMKAYQAKRRVWGSYTQNWTDFDWNFFIFSDKSKFNLFGSDGRHYCWRRQGEEFLARNVKKIVKHGGGSLMVWGCITRDGPGRLHWVEGRMNAHQYCAILSESLLGTIADRDLDPRYIIFQQDNDLKHTFRLAKK